MTDGKFDPWPVQYRGLTAAEIMRLSATDYKELTEQENPVLTKLKTHFSLFCDEKDEVDEVEVTYYRLLPDFTTLFIWSAIIAGIIIYVHFIK